MKFSLFAHMERNTLKQDQNLLYQEFIELCKIADEGGMHAVWTGEHHAMNFTISPNPFLTLIDIANKTKNIRLGTGTVVAPFWHPLKLAGEAAMTDIITQGRLDLGIARGAYSFEYERLQPGMDAWEAGQRMRELIPAVQGLWEGDYVHEGEYYNFPKSTSSPNPLQENGPPIWVAARDPNSHEFAILNNCNVQVTPLWNGDGEVENLINTFDEVCAKHAEIPRPKIMLLMHTYVASDQEDVKKAAKELNRFYNYFGAWFQNKRPISQGFMKDITDEEIAAHPFYTPEAIERDLVIGETDLVIERLKKFEAMGFDEFSFWIDSNMTFERKKASLQRFIDHVMPAF